MAAYRSTAEIEIAASPREVFSYLVERRKQEAWVQQPVEYLPDDPAELHVGYRADERVGLPQEKLVNVQIEQANAAVEVTAYDPPYEMALEVEARTHESQARYLIRPTATGCVFTTQIATRYRGFYTRLGAAAMLFRGGMGRIQTRMLEDGLRRLKELAEGSAPAGIDSAADQRA